MIDTRRVLAVFIVFALSAGQAPSFAEDALPTPIPSTEKKMAESRPVTLDPIARLAAVQELQQSVNVQAIADIHEIPTPLGWDFYKFEPGDGTRPWRELEWVQLDTQGYKDKKKKIEDGTAGQDMLDQIAGDFGVQWKVQADPVEYAESKPADIRDALHLAYRDALLADVETLDQVYKQVKKEESALINRQTNLDLEKEAFAAFKGDAAAKAAWKERLDDKIKKMEGYVAAYQAGLAYYKMKRDEIRRRQEKLEEIYAAFVKKNFPFRENTALFPEKPATPPTPAAPAATSYDTVEALR